jgi:hypothetical protein
MTSRQDVGAQFSTLIVILAQDNFDRSFMENRLRGGFYHPISNRRKVVAWLKANTTKFADRVIRKHHTRKRFIGHYPCSVGP